MCFLFCFFIMYVSFIFLNNNNLYSISWQFFLVFNALYGFSFWYEDESPRKQQCMCVVFSVVQFENHFCLHGRKRHFILSWDSKATHKNEHCLVHVVDWVGLMVVVVLNRWRIYPTICPGGERVWDNHHTTGVPPYLRRPRNKSSCPNLADPFPP